MSKKLSAVLILCMSAMSLSGCSWFRVTGPCYGVGCPGGTAGHSGQYKPGEAPKAQNAPAPAQVAAAQPKTAQPNAPAQTATASTRPAAAESSATASAAAQATLAQPANAQTATTKPASPQGVSPEAKPSPLHSIGEFFAHLIPRRNSGANSGAGN